MASRVVTCNRNLICCKHFEPSLFLREEVCGLFGKCCSTWQRELHNTLIRPAAPRLDQLNLAGSVRAVLWLRLFWEILQPGISCPAFKVLKSFDRSAQWEILWKWREPLQKQMWRAKQVSTYLISFKRKRCSKYMVHSSACLPSSAWHRKKTRAWLCCGRRRASCRQCLFLQIFQRVF